ncbi:MAG: histidine kinase dimerization/phosphoacceptor domain -containing protein [Pseudomonadota bacterium]
MAPGLNGLWTGRGLAVRLVAMLTIALLPIGAIAIWQSILSLKNAQERTELLLLSLTDQEVLGEARLVYSALGAAEALGAVVPDLLDDPDAPEACNRHLGEVAAHTDLFAFAAFVLPEGLMACSSTGQMIDLSRVPSIRSLLARPRGRVDVIARGTVTGAPELFVTRPAYNSEGTLKGYVSLSIPYDRFVSASDGPARDQPLGLVMFNADGQIISAENPVDALTDRLPREERLPREDSLLDFVGGPPAAFTAENLSGRRVSFAVTPVVPDVLYAVGTWEKGNGGVTAYDLPIATWGAPIVMWVVSLLVAAVAMHRQVLRPIRKLGRQMARFAKERHLPEASEPKEMPRELLQIEADFLAMASTLIEDEEALEDALRDKNVLLKEVHHRVKNNLQLISSIMSMQIRRAHSVETKAVLGRLQQRVLGLATIHRNLYQTENLGRVNAADLLREIINQLVIVGGDRALQTEVSLNDVILEPDQAVPLSLLSAEAVTNALKYVGNPEGEPPRLWITLKRDSDEDIRLEVVNTLPPGNMKLPEDPEASGLGTLLIDAFCRQLGAVSDTSKNDETYRLTARFQVRNHEESAVADNRSDHLKHLSTPKAAAEAAE